MINTKIMLLVSATALLSVVAKAQELPILSSDTEVFTVPLLEYQEGGQTAYYSAELQAVPGSYFSTFNVLDARPASPVMVNDATRGTFGGVMVEYASGTLKREVFPLSGCSRLVFDTSSTNFTVSGTDADLRIRFDASPFLTCELSGSAAGGEFQCSTFNKGTWSMRMLRSPAPNVLVATVALTGDRCTADLQFTGIK
ncbi:MAG: hypothetical protein LBF16_08980 [Pseudomonadales bacterium]|jgi:hypothetical protein|nr:hypothetical protein [Pseudomonadales bacterium]